MADRVVVKDNWESAFTDSLSEFFYTWIVGGFLWGGILVSGAGAAVGYFETPQDVSPIPNMAHTALEYNKNTWVFIGESIQTIGTALHEARPAPAGSGVAGPEGNGDITK